MLEKLRSEVEYEIQQIDILLDSYRGLLNRAGEREPDLVETTAIASVLHSFYNGIENLFLRISKELDPDLPVGERWHRDLLSRMAASTDARTEVISTDLGRTLAEYLGFRHFYRHSYSFFLDWAELEVLAVGLFEVWDQVRHGLTQFLEDLDA